ncbi:MAG: toll/interleukin-1 receptor domain-containing protein [Planctomycetaceae bacterium]|nr:toll/interleukin-1 receptor domain-containing protein [Planctomycetaceae bacterium]
MPLRIFLSYGHDANEELVRRIKADLENRGHDVWFDKREIKTGVSCRRTTGGWPSPTASSAATASYRSYRNTRRAIPASVAMRLPSRSV